MRRADRLFQIVQHLRARRRTTAAELSGWLEVSERTVYRDIRDLCASGVPVQGEAGVGYRLGPSFDLPPIMFTLDEVEALVAGARMMEVWGGTSLSGSARSAVSKIALALPAARRGEIENTRMFAPDFRVPPGVVACFEISRLAIQRRRKLRIEYEDGAGCASERTVQPLGLFFWGTTWTLAAWCELRRDFRAFRLDRVRAIEALSDTFQETPGRTLADYLARVHAEASEPAKRSAESPAASPSRNRANRSSH